MTKYRLPAGFTPATTAPNTEDRLEVVLVPYKGDTHYQIATARFEKGRREGARWRTVGGDDVRDYGHQVLGWRKQRDEMKVQVAEPEAGDKDAYRRAIELLAEETIERAHGGEMDVRPKNVAFVSEMFGVSSATVTDDYEARSEELLAARRR